MEFLLAAGMIVFAFMVGVTLGINIERQAADPCVCTPVAGAR